MADQFVECSSTLAWCNLILHNTYAQLLPIALYQHLQVCPCCIERFCSWLQAPLPAAIDLLTCQQSELALAGYVEAELALPWSIDRWYPNLYWHLQACPSCYEHYRLLRSILTQPPSAICTELLAERLHARPQLVEGLRLDCTVFTQAKPTACSQTLVSGLFGSHQQIEYVIELLDQSANRLDVLIRCNQCCSGLLVVRSSIELWGVPLINGMARWRIALQCLIEPAHRYFDFSLLLPA